MKLGWGVVAVLMASVSCVFAHDAEIVICAADGSEGVNRKSFPEDGVLRVSAHEIGLAKWVEITPDFARAKKGEEGYFVLPSGHFGTFREDDGEFSVSTALMPLWGIKTPRGTFAVLVEGLPWDCKVVVRARKGDYAVSMRFDLGGRKAEEDIVVCMKSLAREGGYPEMAAWYRDLRLARGEILPLKDRMAKNSELAYAAKAVEVRIRQAWKPAPPPVKE